MPIHGGEAIANPALTRRSYICLHIPRVLSIKSRKSKAHSIVKTALKVFGHRLSTLKYFNHWH